MEAQPKDIQRYRAVDDKIPFDKWLDSLRDRKARVRIKARLDRVELGNLGDFKAVGEGVLELRIDYGPGYRIYVRQSGASVVVLLCGGDKRSKSEQDKDIQQAKDYWADYNEHRERANKR